MLIDDLTDSFTKLKNFYTVKKFKFREEAKENSHFFEVNSKSVDIDINWQHKGVMQNYQMHEEDVRTFDEVLLTA